MLKPTLGFTSFLDPQSEKTKDWIGFLLGMVSLFPSLFEPSCAGGGGVGEFEEGGVGEQ